MAFLAFFSDRVCFCFDCNSSSIPVASDNGWDCFTSSESFSPSFPDSSSDDEDESIQLKYFLFLN
jgi:hypothetical protein